MSYPPDARAIIRAQIPIEPEPRPLAWRKLAIAAGITLAALVLSRWLMP
jgi:hypothetical protein